MYWEMKRVAWTAEEDERLRRFVARFGVDQWSTAPHRAKLLRDGRACRERWHFYIGPGIKRGPITPEEDDLIIHLHSIHGDRWFDIACKLPGRTEKDVRNRWRSQLSQRLVAQGIDPRTHKPMVQAAGSSQGSGLPPTVSLADSETREINVGPESSGLPPTTTTTTVSVANDFSDMMDVNID